jgi:hypothetical protein
MNRLDNLLEILVDYELISISPAFWESHEKMIYVNFMDSILFAYDIVSGEMEIIDSRLTNEELDVAYQIMDDIEHTYGDRFVEEIEEVTPPTNIIKLADYRNGEPH